jgi:ubiquitin-protein ligase
MTQPDPAALTPTAWKPEQLDRIETEWRQMQRGFAFHPLVHVAPLHGEPPIACQIDYQVRTLVVNERTGQLEYAAQCAVELWLPVDFPQGAPIVKPIQPIFHPNVDAEDAQLIPPWKAEDTLIDVVQRIGQLLAWRSHDPSNVWNPVAMDWLTANSAYVPTDPNADFAVDAGGDPLQRICRRGPATLEALRRQVDELLAAMLDPQRDGEPPGQDLQRLAQRVRLTAGMFIGPEIPRDLGEAAANIERLVSALPAAQVTCDALRRRATGASAGASAAQELMLAVNQLGEQIARLDALRAHGEGHTPETHRSLIEALPTAAELQGAWGGLQGAQIRIEQKIAAAQAALRATESAPAGPALPADIQARIDACAAAQQAGVIATRRQVHDAVSAAELVLRRARARSAALERLLVWREYGDVVERARGVANHAIELGAAGLQAYVIRSDAGEHGPFEFERQVNLGTVELAVRRTSTRGVEAIDLRQGVALGRADRGDLAVVMAGATPTEGSKIVLHPTLSCDELAVQLEYAATHTRALVQRLAMPSEASLPQAESWLEVFASRLAAPEELVTVRPEHETLAAEWSALAGDLRALEPFKERTATYYLLLRVHEALPRYQKELAAARADEQQVADQLAAILKRATPDPLTGHALIPARFHKEYARLSDRREQLEREIERLGAAIKAAAAQVKTRMATLATIGLSLAPTFVALPQLPPELIAVSTAMSDDGIMEVLVEVERMLSVPLYVGPRSSPLPLPRNPLPPAPPAQVPAETPAAAQKVDMESSATDFVASVDESEADQAGGAEDENDIVDWPGT